MYEILVHIEDGGGGVLKPGTVVEPAALAHITPDNLARLIELGVIEELDHGISGMATGPDGDGSGDN